MDIALKRCVQDEEDLEADLYELPQPSWRGALRMDTWPASNTKDQYGYIDGVKGIYGSYGSVDSYNIIGSGSPGPGIGNSLPPERQYSTEAVQKRAPLLRSGPHLTFGISGDYHSDYEYQTNGYDFGGKNKDDWSETAPLLEGSFKFHKHFNGSKVSPEADEKKEEDYSKRGCMACFTACWDRIPWSVLKKLKVILLTLLITSTTIIYAGYPFLEYKWSQISVSKFQPHTYIEDNSDLGYSIVKVFVRGSFLYKHPTRETNNVIITVTNPLTNDSQSWSLVVPSFDELSKVPEDVYDVNFDFTGQQIPPRWQVQVEGNYPYSVAMAISFSILPSKVKSSVIYAAVILGTVYFLIIFEMVHRTVAAMLGSLMALAALALMNQKPDLDTIVTWLDYETLALLFGMMVLVSILTDTGFFDWLALMAYKVAKGKTWPLITTLCILAGVISAFLDNVTTILLLAPVTIRLCEVIDIDPIHVLIAEVMFSNIGGASTAIGDPPNVIILSNRDIMDAGIDFGQFTMHMMLGSILACISTYALTRFMYRKKEFLRSADPPAVAELKHEMKVWQRACNNITVATREENTVKALLMQKVVGLDFEIKRALYEHRQSSARGFKIQVNELAKIYYIRDKWLLAKCLTVLAIVIIMFILSSFLKSFYLSVGWIPIMGALWLLVMSDSMDLEVILHRIEWATLIFFAALFVLMEALTKLGLIEFLTEQTMNIVREIDEDARLAVSIIIILWLSAFASAFIDNIPYTTAMLPVVVRLSGEADLELPLAPLVWALAFGACLGGNGTLIGASCNVVCAGIAENHGHGFTFGQFFKVGFPTMIVSTFVVMLYLLTAHVALGWN